MEQSREERVKRPLGVSLRRKSVPFHKAEKMDEEAVSPSISSDWYSCFSQTRAFQVCLTYGSHDFSWHTLLSLTIFPNYLQGNSFHRLPMSRCGWGLCPPYLSSPFGQLCFTDAARSFHLRPSLSFQQLEMLLSTMSLLPGKKKKRKSKNKQKKTQHALGFCRRVWILPGAGASAFSRCSFLKSCLALNAFPLTVPANVGQAVMMQHTEKHLSPVILDSPWN